MCDDCNHHTSTPPFGYADPVLLIISGLVDARNVRTSSQRQVVAERNAPPVLAVAPRWGGPSTVGIAFGDPLHEP